LTFAPPTGLPLLSSKRPRNVVESPLSIALGACSVSDPLPFGVTLLDGALSLELPPPLCATTVNV